LYLTLYIKHSFSYFCTLLLDRMAHTHRHWTIMDFQNRVVRRSTKWSVTESLTIEN
jgi:hypothetical protein